MRANAGLQLRRAISIQAEGTKLLEKHAIAPSAARLCSAASQGSRKQDQVGLQELHSPLKVPLGRPLARTQSLKISTPVAQIFI
jgi:hypothetical protein